MRERVPSLVRGSGSPILARVHARGEPRRLFLWVALGALLISHAAATLLLVEPGAFSVDEVGYHFQTRAFAESTAPHVWNGYEELASPELEVRAARTVVPRNGALVGKYPYLGPLLASPLYPSLGFSALIVVNALSFVAVVLLTWVLARRYLGPRGAVAACAILVFGTYAWQYSQAAWPHMLALALLMGGTVAVVRALEARRLAGRCVWALAAGLVFGLGIGARLDVVLALGATSAVLLFLRPVRAVEILCLAAGALPGLLALSYENALKHGVFWPFAYTFSHHYEQFLPAAGFIALVVAARAISLHPNWRAHRTKVVRVLAGAGLLAGIALLAVPVSRSFVLSSLQGVYTLVVDLSTLNLGRKEPLMERTATHAVTYVGVVKKALLQSCPFLPVAILAVVGLKRPRGNGAPALLLLLTPLVFILGFGRTAWHGGLCFNLRYFLPVLPFAAILTAIGLRELWPQLTRKWSYAALAAPLATTAGYGALMWPHPSLLSVAEFSVLMLPLLLAAPVGLLGLAFTLGSDRIRRRSAGPLFFASAAALSLAFLVNFTYDYRHTRDRRQEHAEIGRLLLRHVKPDSLVHTPVFDPVSRLVDGDRIRIANPFQDAFEDFVSLTALHLESGRPVYLYVPPYMRFFPAVVSDQNDYLFRVVVQTEDFLLLELATSAPGSPPPDGGVH